MRKVAESLPFTYTGADLYALCSDAMLKAITRSARLVDSRVAAINAERASTDTGKAPITIAQFFDHHATDQDTEVMVSEEDFLGAQRELVPSVSAEELGHYDRVRQEFEGNGEQVKTNGSRQPGPPPNMNDPEQVQRAQAKWIEELIAKGMQDGSLAKGDKGTRERARMKGKGGAATGNGRLESRLEKDEEDDDFVVRTDHLAINGSKEDGKGKMTAKGKGKGKMVDFGSDGFGDAAEDEDLYA